MSPLARGDICDLPGSWPSEMGHEPNRAKPRQTAPNRHLSRTCQNKCPPGFRLPYPLSVFASPCPRVAKNGVLPLCHHLSAFRRISGTHFLVIGDCLFWSISGFSPRVFAASMDYLKILKYRPAGSGSAIVRSPSCRCATGGIEPPLIPRPARKFPAQRLGLLHHQFRHPRLLVRRIAWLPQNPLDDHPHLRPHILIVRRCHAKFGNGRRQQAAGRRGTPEQEGERETRRQSAIADPSRTSPLGTGLAAVRGLRGRPG